MTTLNEENLILSDRPLKVVENQQDICSSLVSLEKSFKSNDFMKAYSMLSHWYWQLQHLVLTTSIPMLLLARLSATVNSSSSRTVLSTTFKVRNFN